MRRGKQVDKWFPLWTDKWLFGSTRQELDHAERAIFTDLMALASKDDGFIRGNETTPMPLAQIAGMLCCTMELLNSTIEKCLKYGKIEEHEGIFYITNWREYSFSVKWTKEIGGGVPIIAKLKEQSSSNVEINGSPIISYPILSSSSLNNINLNLNESQTIAIKAVVAYLNEKTGRKFNPINKRTAGFIKARIAEGRTLDDFKRVIDNKTAKWMNDPKMNDYLRPETLFGTKMEAYINEAPPMSPAASRLNGIWEWYQEEEAKKNAGKK
jgi:uncharacterized phage protein (TIGR02220 family)